MSRIQVLACKASYSVLFFLFEISNNDGATSLGLQPCIHALSQNCVFLPSPIIIVVAAAKRSRSVSLQGISSPIQGLLSGFQARHNHHKRSAHAKIFRCRTPKPPFFFDLAVLIQLTLHFPPVNISVPAQRNCLRLLSISSNVAFGGFSADKK